MANRKKTRGSANDCITITRYALKKMKDEIEYNAVRKMMLLYTAYLMEEPEINFDEDRIIECWDGVSRYADAIDSHLITMDKVGQIISEHTGMQVKW